MKVLTLSALPLLAFATLAEARSGTLVEQRGYATCYAQFEANSNGLRTERHYLVDQRADNPRFFINGSRWENGDRSAVRMSCDTDSKGLKVLLSSIEPGHYVSPNPKVTIDVADSDR